MKQHSSDYRHACAFYWIYVRSHGSILHPEPVYSDSIPDTDRDTLVSRFRQVAAGGVAADEPFTPNLTVGMPVKCQLMRDYAPAAARLVVYATLGGHFAWTQYSLLQCGKLLAGRPGDGPTPGLRHFIGMCEDLGKKAIEKELTALVGGYEERVDKPLLVTFGHYSGRPLLVDHCTAAVADAYYRVVCGLDL